MITLITGAPGTGKSAALVSLLSELAKNRTVYVSGIPDLAIPHEELEDPTKWPELVPDGCIIVIDEVQRVWRPRGPGQKVPPDIAALETHRHRGIDLYVVTQAPRLMDSNIRGLVGRHVHLRDLGILGRWWYEWPECADNCATAWKNAPIKKRYRLPKAIFGQYKSATQHIKPIRSFPWMLVIMVLALLVTAGTAWRAYASISSKLNPPGKAQEAPKTLNDIKAGQAPQAQAPASYDTTQFIPRLSAKPETAPAYDHLRMVVAMPMVAGAICTSKRCVCVTQQGSSAGLSEAECRTWLKETPFNPYATPTVSASGTPSGYTPSPDGGAAVPASESPAAAGPSHASFSGAMPSKTASTPAARP